MGNGLEQGKEKRERFVDRLEKSAIEGVAAESIQRYGDAAKQHLVAYSGIDNEAGKTLTRSLKKISKYAVNPDYAEKNIKQQAGFSAEVKTVARRNAERIINKQEVRTTRTDDIGSVNDELYDLVDLNENGEKIIGTASQMKFVGASPDKLLDKLNSKKFQKYIDADSLLDIADDDYDALMGADGTKGIIDQRIENLHKQLNHAEKSGKAELADKKRNQIEKYKTIKKNLRKTGMTRKEAIEARIHPKLSTAKDVAAISHKAGIEQMKYGAVVSGSVSIVKNIVACVRGEKSPEEVAQSVALDTGKGAVVSYATAFAGTTVKGVMQNSKSAYVRSLSKTNLATGLVTTTLDIGKILHKYMTGRIDGAECIEELGENGVGRLGSALFAGIGSSVVPSAAPVAINVIGGIAGATFGYVAAVAIYQELSTSLKEAKIAHERRLHIEAECAQAVQLIQQYRREMEEVVEKYFTENSNAFRTGFKMIDKAILENDVDGFIKGNAEIQKVFGKEVQFTNQNEFNALMESDIPLQL